MLTVEISSCDKKRCNDIEDDIEALLIDDYGFRYDTPDNGIFSEGYVSLVNEERGEAVMIYY